MYDVELLAVLRRSSRIPSVWSASRSGVLAPPTNPPLRQSIIWQDHRKLQPEVSGASSAALAATPAGQGPLTNTEPHHHVRPSRCSWAARRSSTNSTLISRQLGAHAIAGSLRIPAPMAAPLFTKTVAARFDYSRLMRARAETSLALVPRCLQRKDALNEFIWPRERPFRSPRAFDQTVW